MARRKKKNNVYFELIIFALIIGFTIYTNVIDKTYADETSSEAQSFNDSLEVQFIDVGQADSILVRNKDDVMLIDAGNNEDGPLLVSYLHKLNIDKITYLIGTHAHEDHIGGMNDIIDSFDIGTFYMPDAITTTKTFEEVLDSLEVRGLYFDTPSIGEEFNLGDSKVKVLYVGTDSNDLNSTSIVLKLTHGNISFLFTGDATSEIEKKLLKSDISADVLKVAHHGSKYSSTSVFLKKVNPKYAVISVGENNTYAHPSDNIIKRLESMNTRIYRTDRDGTIVMESDGNVLNIEKRETQTDGKK